MRRRKQNNKQLFIYFIPSFCFSFYKKKVKKKNMYSSWRGSRGDQVRSKPGGWRAQREFRSIQQKPQTEDEALDAFRRVGFRAFLDPILMRLFDPLDIPSPPPMKPAKPPRYGPMDIASCLEYIKTSEMNTFRNSVEKPPETKEEEEEKEKEKEEMNFDTTRLFDSEKNLLINNGLKSCDKNQQNVKRNSPTKIILYNISYETRPEDIDKLLSRYGFIRKLDMVYDKKTLIPRGYAFIEFDTTEDANRVISSAALSRLRLDGRILKADHVRKDDADFTEYRNKTRLEWRSRRSAAQKKRPRRRSRGAERVRERNKKKRTDAQARAGAGARRGRGRGRGGRVRASISRGGRGRGI